MTRRSSQEPVSREGEPKVLVTFVFLPPEPEAVLLCVSPQSNYVPVTEEQLKQLETMGGSHLLLVNGLGEVWEETTDSVREAWGKNPAD